MDSILEQKILIQKELTLSDLLHEAQEISGRHCESLGFGWETMQAKGLFWAVLRHKIEIHSLPEPGQTVLLQTWPMPTTRSYYPRVIRALDESGNILFTVASIWVTMDTQTRAMVLPGKNGVAVPGFCRGNEPALPTGLPPEEHENITCWQVDYGDLDRNGHVNNGKYLIHVEPLLGTLTPKAVTVCYLAEVLPGEKIDLHWTLSGDKLLSVDGHRARTDVCSGKQRVFAVRVTC